MLRIAVFGLRRWLDRQVLPAQNVFVDRPHLLQRQPRLALERDVLKMWHVTRTWCEEPDPAAVPESTSTASRWLGRPVWRWAERASDPPRGPRFLPTDPVFCEDTSGFVLADAARDFVTDLPGTFQQRFIAHVDGVDYHPRRRLLT